MNEKDSAMVTDQSIRTADSVIVMGLPRVRNSVGYRGDLSLRMIRISRSSNNAD